MRYLPTLFANNRAWAESQARRDPGFFDRLSTGQAPRYLWIGCADSRVPPSEVLDVAPGDLFVHRNVANVIRPDDVNCRSVIQYAVDVLKVEHLIVCGHYSCGGVQAAFGPAVPEPLETWLVPIRKVRADHRPELDAIADDDARWRRLCELNVVEQVRAALALPTVQDAWARGQQLVVHGWILDLRDGLLRDLDVSAARPE